ncbi:MAG: hypothetical protein JWM98_2726 [Thermoleophilia bacterium]|nr:hypothetical protein [Thermoleophilia bacterium]
MIVRIMGEGQFELPETALDSLNEHDGQLTSAIEGGDEAAFSSALEALLGQVRTSGSPCADDFLGESDFVLPSSDSTIETVAGLLAEDGLVPG